MVTKTFTVITNEGLHARPATLLVSESSKYKSNIFIEYNEKQVSAKSILGVMSLGIHPRSNFSIKIDGVDEEKAIEGIEDLLNKERIAE